MAFPRSNATRADREEVQAKRSQYGEFMRWTDRGILRDLHGITNPDRELLLAIA
jgi:hypothetical protein